MITILFHLRTRPGTEPAARELLAEMTRVSRADEGCLHYTFHQQRDDQQQWMLYEQWRDPAALEAHVAHMKQCFGAPPAGARLPARLDALTESSSITRYEVLA